MSKILDMLAALATVGMFFITFFLIRMKFDLGFRDARGQCATERSSVGNDAKNKAGSAARPLQLRIRIARVTG